MFAQYEQHAGSYASYRYLSVSFLFKLLVFRNREQVIKLKEASLLLLITWWIQTQRCQNMSYSTVWKLDSWDHKRDQIIVNIFKDFHSTQSQKRDLDSRRITKPYEVKIVSFTIIFSWHRKKKNCVNFQHSKHPLVQQHHSVLLWWAARPEPCSLIRLTDERWGWIQTRKQIKSNAKCECVLPDGGMPDRLLLVSHRPLMRLNFVSICQITHSCIRPDGLS